MKVDVEKSLRVEKVNHTYLILNPPLGLLYKKGLVPLPTGCPITD